MFGIEVSLRGGGGWCSAVTHSAWQKPEKTYVHSSRLATAYVAFCSMGMLKECEKQGRQELRLLKGGGKGRVPAILRKNILKTMYIWVYCFGTSFFILLTTE